MKEIIITPREEGQRLDRLLTRYLPHAGTGFLYRMMRKKNITLNGKKPAGNEKLKAGDSIRIWFSDETLGKFTAAQQETKQKGYSGNYTAWKVGILYEDEHILLTDKPAGLLTQKASAGDYSLNDWILEYLLSSGNMDENSMNLFRPSVCNRLDRNTSGIVTAGKTAFGARLLSAMFRDRNVHKDYQCILTGHLPEGEKRVEGHLVKEESTNLVRIRAKHTGTEAEEDGRYICTQFHPVRYLTGPDGSELTLAQVRLITGRPHQIRAQMAEEGYPILGDPKYGDPVINQIYRKTAGIKGQLLHCRYLAMPLKEAYPDIPEQLSGRIFEAPLPAPFQKLLVNTNE